MFFSVFSRADDVEVAAFVGQLLHQGFDGSGDGDGDGDGGSCRDGALSACVLMMLASAQELALSSSSSSSSAAASAAAAAELCNESAVRAAFDRTLAATHVPRIMQLAASHFAAQPLPSLSPSSLSLSRDLIILEVIENPKSQTQSPHPQTTNLQASNFEPATANPQPQPPRAGDFHLSPPVPLVGRGRSRAW